jgi:hypothetical protein
MAMPDRQQSRTPLEAVQGSDASRRVAWARYYKAQEDIKTLQRHNRTLQRRLARFAVMIAASEELAVLDPEGELIREAIATVAALRARAYGRRVLDEISRTGDTPTKEMK